MSSKIRTLIAILSVASFSTLSHADPAPADATATAPRPVEAQAQPSRADQLGQQALQSAQEAQALRAAADNFERFASPYQRDLVIRFQTSAAQAEAAAVRMAETARAAGSSVPVPPAPVATEAPAGDEGEVIPFAQLTPAERSADLAQRALALRGLAAAYAESGTNPARLASFNNSADRAQVAAARVAGLAGATQQSSRGTANQNSGENNSTSEAPAPEGEDVANNVDGTAVDNTSAGNEVPVGTAPTATVDAFVHPDQLEGMNIRLVIDSTNPHIARLQGRIPRECFNEGILFAGPREDANMMANDPVRAGQIGAAAAIAAQNRVIGFRMIDPKGQFRNCVARHQGRTVCREGDPTCVDLSKDLIPPYNTSGVIDLSSYNGTRQVCLIDMSGQEAQCAAGAPKHHGRDVIIAEQRTQLERNLSAGVCNRGEIDAARRDGIITADRHRQLVSALETSLARSRFDELLAAAEEASCEGAITAAQNIVNFVAQNESYADDASQALYGLASRQTGISASAEDEDDTRRASASCVEKRFSTAGTIIRAARRLPVSDEMRELQKGYQMDFDVAACSVEADKGIVVSSSRTQFGRTTSRTSKNSGLEACYMRLRSRYHQDLAACTQAENPDMDRCLMLQEAIAAVEALPARAQEATCVAADQRIQMQRMFQGPNAPVVPQMVEGCPRPVGVPATNMAGLPNGVPNLIPGGAQAAAMGGSPFAMGSGGMPQGAVGPSSPLAYQGASAGLIPMSTPINYGQFTGFQQNPLAWATQANPHYQFQMPNPGPAGYMSPMR